MSPRNPQAFFGDDAEGLLHAADRACGHAEWPNSRPEGVPHGNQVQTRDPNDARGMAQASIPCCGQASLIPLPIILRQGSPLGCVVWLADIRSGDRNGRLAGFSPMYACHVSHCMYLACGRPYMLGRAAAGYIQLHTTSRALTADAQYNGRSVGPWSNCQRPAILQTN